MTQSPGKVSLKSALSVFFFPYKGKGSDSVDSEEKERKWLVKKMRLAQGHKVAVKSTDIATPSQLDDKAVTKSSKRTSSSW